MPASRRIDSWQQVGCREDFASYLRFLAHDCERPHSEDGSGDVIAGPWVHTGVDGFLWGWVRVLGRRPDGTGSLFEEVPGRPGWRGLACQLDTIRTTPPGFNCVLADSDTRAEDVHTARDLRMYAAALAMDVARDRRARQSGIERGERADGGRTLISGTLPDWFASWAAWVGADSPLHARLDPVTWRSIALQLAAVT